ncbi:MAG TPA: long-chain fatty acid--CoA ligase [Cyclobacteriaceae bacterium]|nr:long-chain fatty acid--CoA ligase [Cyclobacteriaceae bacterium]
MSTPITHTHDFARVFDIPAYQASRYPNNQALNERKDGQWQATSVSMLQQRVDAVSAALIEEGYIPGEKILIIPVMGSIDWVVLDLACQQIGMIVVPIHPTARAEEFHLILTETEARCWVSADETLYQKFQAFAPDFQHSYHLITAGDRYFKPLLANTTDADSLSRVRERMNTISDSDIFTILYTSGSSGKPKGVQLSHRNVVHNIKSILALLPLESGNRVLSFLPFSHVFERTTCYAYLAFGTSVYFSERKETFAQDFHSARPLFCTSVPRVLEKMVEYLEEEMVRHNVIKKKIIQWAMSIGKKYQHRRNPGLTYRLQLVMARLLVLRKWRRQLGGSIRYIAVGAASLRPEIGRLFSAAGILVVEGYGMTETSPIITMNRYEPGLNRFGTVGLALPGIEIKLEEMNEEGEGEILVKGPNVTSGYFRQEALTREAFTEDGWFRTGDVGRWEHQRFLKITDRKKDIFKTSAGKYIAPLPLQQHFCTSPFIQRCLIIGFQRPFVTALLVPNFAHLELWCQEQDIHWTSPTFMVHNIRVRAKYEESIDLLNGELPNHERIRNFVLCHEEWTTENGEITPTLKPVRHLLMEHYKNDIEKMYA